MSRASIVIPSGCGASAPLREVPITSNPASRSSSAQAQPMPDDAPVTSARALPPLVAPPVPPVPPPVAPPITAGSFGPWVKDVRGSAMAGLSMGDGSGDGGGNR